jgi:hypothetical protein
MAMQSGMLDVNDARLYYEIRGQGPALLPMSRPYWGSCPVTIRGPASLTG